MLILPELTDARRTMQMALLEASAREDATMVLGVSASLGELVAANLDVPTSRVGPAALVYTGVLFEAAGLAELAEPMEPTEPAVPAESAGDSGAAPSETARRRLAEDVLIASALYGMVGPLDAIAPYRMNMSARPRLPGARTPAAFWRGPLRAALDARAEGDVVVDARSGAYAAAWTPPAGADHLAVRVEREVDGRRSVVSHSAKHLRGVLAGHLLRRAGAAPASAEAVLDAAREMLGAQVGTATTPLTLVDADLVPAARATAPDQLVLVTR